MTIAENGSRPRHMPWNGSHRPFSIGLRPLDPDNWFEIDDRLGEYLDEKERLWKADCKAVFAAEPDTEDTQAEILDLVASHLLVKFPDLYSRDGSSIRVRSAGRTVDLGDSGTPDLVKAARLVQEDLLVMRKSENGWRLVAGSLSFPSTWSLHEKFGRPLQDIHGPVPGFGRGTRNAELIQRIFDNLQVGMPVWRAGWSLYPDDALFHGETKFTRFGAANRRPGEERFIRVETQTLRKLAGSGDILFTVRIHIDPIDFLVGHPQGAELATALVARLQEMNPAQLRYKGLEKSRDLLIARLVDTAGAMNEMAVERKR